MSIVDNINYWLKLKGLTPTDVAKAAGRDVSPLYKILDGSSTDPRNSTLAWVASGLGITIAELQNPKISPDIHGYVEAKSSHLHEIKNPSISAPQTAEGTGLMPLYGKLRAGTSNVDIEAGPIDWVPVPSFMERRKDAFAMQVVGDCMEPRFNPGEMVYVDPYDVPVAGDDVAIELDDGTGFIKRLVKMTENDWVFKQLNPEERLTLKRRDVKRVMRIRGTEFRR